jgi:hypothetical protein
MTEPGGNTSPSTAVEDDLHREGVMLFLLVETRLSTIEEVVAHRQAFEPPERQQLVRDGTERAIRDMAAMGVLNIEGHTVYVSRAAREGARLWEGDGEIPPW